VEVAEGNLLVFEEFMQGLFATVSRDLVQSEDGGAENLIPKVLEKP
jgi:hypothetical protein